MPYRAIDREHPSRRVSCAAWAFIVIHWTTGQRVDLSQQSSAMTAREEIVRRAVKLIGTAACRGDIEYTLNVLEGTQTNIEFRSKPSKQAAQQLYRALP